MHIQEDAELFSITSAACTMEGVDMVSDKSVWVRQYTEWEEEAAPRCKQRLEATFSKVTAPRKAIEPALVGV